MSVSVYVCEGVSRAFRHIQYERIFTFFRMQYDRDEKSCLVYRGHLVLRAKHELHFSEYCTKKLFVCHKNDMSRTV